MKDVIIFGAGNNGKLLFDILEPWKRVAFYLDNDTNKIGNMCRGRDIRSVSSMEISDSRQYDVLLSVDNDDIRNQLSDMRIHYYNISDFFYEKRIMHERDLYIFDKFLYNKRDVQALFKQSISNYFREDYYNAENKRIIENFCTNKNGFYDVADALDFDENVYWQRPVLRLISNIIHSINGAEHVCDIGCGEGALIIELKKEGYSVTGSDASRTVQIYLRKKGIDIRCESIENCSFSNDEFDVVVCTEVLEHVFDIEKAMSSINKICVIGGNVFISVPYGNECGHVSHVRQFTENSLANLLMQNGFDIINVQRVPCTNDDYLSHILCWGVKRK